MMPPRTPALRRARGAVLAVFFINGFALGGWFVRIPAVQDRLGVGEGLLGVALLGAAVGALLSMTVTGALISRLGSRRVVGATALLLPISLIPLALAPNVVALALALLLVGAANGASTSR
jgi:MFS family permease